MTTNWSTDKLGLLTDLYQLTMGYAYWKNKTYRQQAVFHLYFRTAPFGGDYAISCGLAEVIDYLKQLRFTVNEIQYLAGLKGGDGKALFDESYLNYLQRWEFSCDVDGIPEGTLVFPNEPILRIRGPLLQAQLIETALLNLINFPTLIATKATRIVQAAEGDAVLEFGLRRAQGIDGGITASRAAFVGGCQSTSNVLAGHLYKIPVKGTHAHSWIMSHESELMAFERYAEVMPNNCIFLVDTYDTVQGIKNAITVGLKLKKKGFQMQGIRLDSGDLGAWSKIARKMLDEAGLPEARIVASSDLDEYKIAKLKADGAQIDVWGVGTKLSTAYDQAALGGVYKLAALKQEGADWTYKIKLSEDAIKTSSPGQLQVKRYFRAGKPVGDMIYDLGTDFTQVAIVSKAQQHQLENVTSEELLVPIFKEGQCVYESPSLPQIQQRCKDQLTLFSKEVLKNYPTGLEKNLHALKEKLRQSFLS